MKYNVYSILAAAALISGLSACQKENDFFFSEGEGQLNASSLSVDYINSGLDTRAGVNVGDFNIDFVNTASNEVVKSFKYSEMPEIVALPQGNYRAEASFGTNPPSGWDVPYYVGNSEFDIEVGKITDEVPPVECELSNIRVKVNISDLGLGILGNDAKVEVEAGRAEMLPFYQYTQETGYFRYDGSNTIIATFSGTVDGTFVTARRTYDNADAGNAYTINFTVNKPDNMDPGDIVIGDGSGSGIDIDATITIQDQNVVIDPNEPDDNILVDDMRPSEDPITPPDQPGDEPGGDTPGGDEPGGDTPGGDTPAAGPKMTQMSSGLIYNGSADLASLSECKFHIESNTGITAFTIRIDSEKLNATELEDMGLATEMDLINDVIYAEALSGLGFPVGDEVKNQTDCEFNITNFLGMLAILGKCEHKFYLTVTDDEGTLECWFGLVNK